MSAKKIESGIRSGELLPCLPFLTSVHAEAKAQTPKKQKRAEGSKHTFTPSHLDKEEACAPKQQIIGSLAGTQKGVTHKRIRWNIGKRSHGLHVLMSTPVRDIISAPLETAIQVTFPKMNDCQVLR